MTTKQINRRIAAVKTADAINAIEGVPVSDYASRQELFLSIGKRYSRSSDQPVQTQQASTTQRRAPRSAMGLYSEDTRP